MMCQLPRGKKEWLFSGVCLLFSVSPMIYGQSTPFPLGQRTELGRYEQIWRVSPFVAVTDLSGQADNLAGRYVLTGFARIGDREVVYVFDRTTLERFSLRLGQIRNGISLESLQHYGNLMTARATIRSGDRVVELRYDPTVLPDAGGQQPANVRVVPQPANVPVFPNAPQGGSVSDGSNPGQPVPPWYPPGLPPGLPPNHPAVIQAMQRMQSMPQAIRGSQPAVEPQPVPPPEENPPQPRRIIRRRAIVAPQ